MCSLAPTKLLDYCESYSFSSAGVCCGFFCPLQLHLQGWQVMSGLGLAVLQFQQGVRLQRPASMRQKDGLYYAG
jgi:hypothetical protein